MYLHSKKFLRYIATLLAFVFSVNLYADSNDAIPTNTVTAGVQVFSYNSQSYLVVNFKNEDGWHTYWENPGDAGLPTSIELVKGPKKLKLDSLEWPVPERFVTQDGLTSYGYGGEYSRFFRFDPWVHKGSSLRILIKWLSCKRICIPGVLDAKLEVDEHEVKVVGASVLPNVSREILVKRIEALPKESTPPSDLDIVMHRKGDNLLLYYNISGVKPEQVKENINILTPFRRTMLTFKQEQLYHDKQGNIFGKMTVEWDGAHEDPEVPLPKDGQFKQPLIIKFLYADPKSDKRYIIKKDLSSFNISGTKRVDDFYKLLTPFSNQGAYKKSPEVAVKDSEKPREKSIWLYILLAFIGGTILNIMPCVLPVISLKLFGLLSVRGSSRMVILKHNIVYTAGILFAFLVMGLVVALLKSTGEDIGWGFHLQSPHFIMIMIITLLIMSFNLFGMFEFRTPFGNKLGQVNLKSNFAGDFLGGVIATALSTPCSAPFLGTALTFAFTSSPAVLILIFLFVGLGLAFPFILTGLMPELINVLPKPGKWMEDVKKLLGFTLLLAIVWLLDVLHGLVGGGIIELKIHTFFVLLFFAFYLQKYITKKKVWRVGAFLLPVLMFTNISAMYSESNISSDADSLVDRRSEGMVQWEKWSVEKMEEYKEQGYYVFINFTAKWCFTCKVNERLVFNTEGFSRMVDKYNVKLMMGDWTRRDDEIGTFLKINGLVGIPAYFLQKPDGDLINLEETITLKKLEGNLKDAHSYCES